jgi:hypothetical protein
MLFVTYFCIIVTYLGGVLSFVYAVNNFVGVVLRDKGGVGVLDYLGGDFSGYA